MTAVSPTTIGELVDTVIFVGTLFTFNVLGSELFPAYLSLPSNVAVMV